MDVLPPDNLTRCVLNWCHPAWLELLITQWEMPMLPLGLVWTLHNWGQFMHLLCNSEMKYVWFSVYQRAWMCWYLPSYCVLQYVKCCNGLVPCGLLIVHCCYIHSFFHVHPLSTCVTIWKRFQRQNTIFSVKEVIFEWRYICYVTDCAVLWFKQTSTCPSLPVPFIPHSADGIGEALWDL